MGNRRIAVGRAAFVAAVAAGERAGRSAAWLFHPQGIEIGPALVIDTDTSGTTLLTLNLALGFAL